MDILADLMKEDLSGIKLQALKTQFAVDGVSFRLQDKVVVIEVENDFAKAAISPFGASVLQYQPAGEQPVLWQSPSAVFDGKNAIRGGIPICWPWFGKAKTQFQSQSQTQKNSATTEELPAHGFVRSRDWQIVSIEKTPAGTQLVFSIESDGQTKALWPHDFHLQLRVLVGKTLSLTLISQNLSDRPVEVTQALHSYFKVSNVDQVRVTGLNGSECIDTLQTPVMRQATDALLDGTEPSALAIKAPIDSVFVDQAQTLQIVDQSMGRKIQIEKTGASSIIWNPGPETVKGFVDIVDDAWPGFLCVEAGNVWENALQLSPGAKHNLTLTIQSLKF